MYMQNISGNIEEINLNLNTVLYFTISLRVVALLQAA